MAQLSNVLLFDPDKIGLEVLTQGFEREGVSVAGTSDAATVRELLQGSAHGLLVVVLREPDQIGLDLVRNATTTPKTRNVGCVVIGRGELRPAAQNAGAFAFLTTPLYTRDVLGACRLAAAAMIPGSRPSPDAEVSVALAAFGGLHHLVRAMNVAERSAIVELRQGTRRGELRFVDGALRSVQLGPLQGFAALHHVLLWDNADLKFRFKNVVRRGDQFSMKRAELLEDCERFLRDFAHEVKAVGVARTVYALRAERAGSAPTDLAPVSRLFDGTRSLAQVIEESPFRVFDTIRASKRLADAGVIALAPGSVGPVPAPAQPGAGPLDPWFGRALPPLGPEIGSVSPPSAGAAAVARPSSPFVSVADDEDKNAGVPSLRQRTITRPQHSVPASPPTAAGGDGNNPGRAVSPGTPAGPAANGTLGARTPPPVLSPASSLSAQPSSVTQPLRNSDDRPSVSGRHSTLVARGEITVARPTTRQTGPAVPLDAPKVMVEIEPAAKRPSEAPPSVIVALTPPPERLIPPRPTKSATENGPLPGGGGPGPIVFRQDPAAAARVAGVTPPLTPISPAVDDVADVATPPPVSGTDPKPTLQVTGASSAAYLRAEAPAAGTAPLVSAIPTSAPGPAPPGETVSREPAPGDARTEEGSPSALAAPQATPPAPDSAPTSGEPSHRNGNPSHSHAFDALESDFFAREADLYKGDSGVESFDDLEGKPKGPRRRS